MRNLPCKTIRLATLYMINTWWCVTENVIVFVSFCFRNFSDSDYEFGMRNGFFHLLCRLYVRTWVSCCLKGSRLYGAKANGWWWSYSSSHLSFIQCDC